ncbi:hypothetical protein JCM10207_005575 [Rhodosporidiobolus poonsookiae]
MPTLAEPSISTHTLLLDLFPLSPLFPDPLYAHLSLLSPAANATAMLFVGGAPLPFAMSRDAAVAVTRPTGPPAATSLSKTSSSSLALSSRLAKRYNRQLFVSLDLSSLPADRADQVLAPMESALVVELDKVLGRPVKKA